MTRRKILPFSALLSLFLTLSVIILIAFQGKVDMASGQSSPIPTPPYPVHPDDQHILEKLQELPYSDTPYEGAPVLRPDPAFVSMSLEERDAISKTLIPDEIVYVSGPETAGSKIVIGDKEIQLPLDVYVGAYITSISCILQAKSDGTYEWLGYCPRTPYYTLAKFDSEAHVRIEADGQIYTWERTIESAEIDRQTFQFVLNALDTELKLDEPMWHVGESTPPTITTTLPTMIIVSNTITEGQP